MTSRKDLLEAQAFTRRRVLAVLVGGAAGGREPEPAATGRSLLGGVVLAVVVALVVAVVALLDGDGRHGLLAVQPAVGARIGPQRVVLASPSGPTLPGGGRGVTR